MKKCPRCRRRHGEDFAHCTPCRQYQRAYKVRLRAARRAAARCPGCGNSELGGFEYCERCRADVAERKALRIAEGRCSNCGKPQGERSDRLCDPCSDDRNVRQRRQLLNPERYASHRAICANWRERKRRAAAQAPLPVYL